MMSFQTAWNQFVQQGFAGKSDDYYVDDALVAKFESIFEEPDKNEVDFWMAQEKK